MTSMRKLIVVGSSIQPRSGKFTYSPTRSLFSAEERFRQTIFTINSLRNSFPDSKIVIVDSSNDYKEYQSLIHFFSNVEFIPLKELSGEAFEIANSNINKSVCESVLLNAYYRQYKKEIQQYDILVKATGRYFYFDFNDSSFTHNEIYFKKPLNFEWNDTWKYEFVDRRREQNNNRIHQYCTVLYAFGTKHLDKFIDINEAAIHFMKLDSMYHYDIETLSYYLTRPYEPIITETNWRVSGWDGVSGKFMYY
jgi:hypothetical protein